MQLEIYNEDDDVVYLKLRKTTGGISVVAVDSGGDERSAGHLVTFTNGGNLHLEGSVGRGLGFKLDSAGKIMQV